jgi:hypothetical protein
MSSILRVSALTTLLALVAATPAWAQKVNADWDKAANFASYKSYKWSTGRVPEGTSPLMIQRIESAVESELASIGLVKVEKDPDVLVAFQGATKEDVSLQSWGYSPRWGGGQVDVNRVLVGTLLIDLIDAKTDKLVFRATASDTVSDNPQKNEKKIQKAVEKMFEKYPGASGK